MENLIYGTLEEIAIWVRTVKLRAAKTDQPKTETFFEDDTIEDTPALRRLKRSYKGKET